MKFSGGNAVVFIASMVAMNLRNSARVSVTFEAQNLLLLWPLNSRAINLRASMANRFLWAVFQANESRSRASFSF